MATESKYKISALVAKVDQLLAKGREQYADTSDDDLKAMIQDGHHEKVMLGMLLEGRRQERLNKKNSSAIRHDIPDFCVRELGILGWEG